MAYCCPITNTTSNGGFSIGSSAIVDLVNDPWDGFAGVWPINETGDGTAEEYKDRSRFLLHARGGNGSDPELVPRPDEGVFCQPSQRFEGRQSIEVPADNLNIGQGFSASCWGRIKTYYTPRVFFSRGHTTPDGDEWVFSLGHTFLNQVHARLQTYSTDGTKQTYQAVGSTMLSQNQFYHFAASWEPNVGIKVFVNGVLSGSVSVPQKYTQPLTNSGYFSKFDGGSWITGNIQDVRLHGSVRSAAWFLAEFQNYCQSGFFTVGGEEG